MNEPIAADQPVLAFDAPTSTTETTGITSFQAQFDPKELTSSIVAFTTDHQQAAEFRTRMDQTLGLTSVIPAETARSKVSYAERLRPLARSTYGAVSEGKIFRSSVLELIPTCSTRRP